MSSEDPSGRYINSVVEIDGKRLQFCNVYAPNQVSLRKQFFENFTGVLKGGIPTVLGGDFNSIEDIYLDKNGGDKDLAVSALQSLQELNRNFNLKDVFRHLNPSSRVFTWNSADGLVSCRLDKFYVSRDIFRTSSDCSITFFPYSDHEAVNLSFRLPDYTKRGPGLWKLNTSLLNNSEYVEKIKMFWQHWQKRKKDFTDLNIWWDIGKKKIKHISIRFSKKLVRKARTQRRILESQLNTLIASNTKNNNKESIERVKSELIDIDNKTIAGAKIRSKERFYTEFEKPSNYFFNLESSRQSSKVITSIKKDDLVLSSSGLILEELAAFYESLYSSENLDFKASEQLLFSIDKTLDEEERDSLENDINIESAFSALSVMKPRKSPGSDGLPSEFYKCFWICLMSLG